MKKTDALQLVVITFAMYCGMQFLIGLPSLIFYLYYWFGQGLNGGGYMETLIISIITLASYLLMALMGIKQSGKIADWIDEKVSSNIPPVNINIRGALFISLVAVAIYGLIKNIPGNLTQLYAYFKEEEGGGLIGMATTKPGGLSVIMDLMETGLYLILLIYAHVFADMLFNRIEPREIEKATEDLGKN